MTEIKIGIEVEITTVIEAEIGGRSNEAAGFDTEQVRVEWHLQLTKHDFQQVVLPLEYLLLL